MTSVMEADCYYQGMVEKCGGESSVTEGEMSEHAARDSVTAVMG